MKEYSFNKGPSIEIPKTNGLNPYQKKQLKNAKTLYNTTEFINSILKDTTDLESDIYDLNIELNKLLNYCNNTIIINDIKQEVLPKEHITLQKQNLDMIFENNIKEIKQKIDIYEDTISEINNYIKLLTNNYNEYCKLQNDLKYYQNMRNNMQVIADAVKSNVEINRLSIELQKYTDIGDINEYGDWIS